MSQENVELTYRVIDLFNRRDLPVFLTLMAEDVWADPLLAGIEGGYRGHDGIRRWWKTLIDLIPDFTVEVIEVREYGNEWVLSVVRLRGHGAESNAPFEATTWFSVHIRERKCVWWGNYPTEAEALEAAGLQE
jgi:ketosteroid isomerase-like protein